MATAKSFKLRHSSFPDFIPTSLGEGKGSFLARLTIFRSPWVAVRPGSIEPDCQLWQPVAITTIASPSMRKNREANGHLGKKRTI